jgi:nitrogen fixation protein FixH
MKLHWGIKIFTVYGLFVALMIFMVMQSMKHDVDLVSKDYYAQELAFQGQIEKTNRAKTLKEQPKWSIRNGSFILTVPNITAGDVTFFRPSNQKLDFTVSLNEADSGEFEIPLNSFASGMYKMKIDFEIEGELYYKEEIVVIP